MSTTTTTVQPLETLSEKYARVRQLTRTLCETLNDEDCCIQSMPDVSPTRWHLAHTTWFFETFVLSRLDGYRPSEGTYAYLFNSYYNALGDQFPRERRGLLSRPTVSEVWHYRNQIDEQMQLLLQEGEANRELATIVDLGLNHEQQHQELVLMDIKHVFSCNPLFPVYRDGVFASELPPASVEWIHFGEGLYWIGHNEESFAYDNEGPAHRVFLQDFSLANRLVTCGEYLEFIEDGGYRRPEFWLAEGWREVQKEGWSAPLYWMQQDGEWKEFTLAGLRSLDLTKPLCHVSYFEADAYARWAGYRLPTEQEWEVASHRARLEGSFVDQLLADGLAIHPQGGWYENAELAQMFGQVWQWTSSSYAAYPGYRPASGAIGEYNGKFMCNQYVLRGGSCATSSDHIRRTYRNFFPAHARWQFSGIRLAK